MTKIPLFIATILLYLTVAKIFHSPEFDIIIIEQREDLKHIIKETPATVILIDTHASGFLIKTYFHKYRIVYGFRDFEEVIVKVKRKFSQKNEKFLGLSLFRTLDGQESTNTTPLPPGFIFVDNPAFGKWVKKSNNEEQWQFYRAYRRLPLKVGWGDFQMTKKFHQKAKLFQKQSIPYLGEEGVFGPQGEITQKNFPQYFDTERQQKLGFKTLIMDYIKENFSHE